MKFGAKTQSRRGLITALLILAVVLLVVGVVAFARKPNLPASTDASTSTSSEVGTLKDTETETDTSDSTASSDDKTVAVADPETLTSVDIAPLAVTVFYSKGTPGFEYSVLKTANATEYVQFTSTDLIGTKCTDDEGAFASIIKNPSTDEAQTTSQTVKVVNDTYGLSLASAGCTGNTELLSQYQDGFKNGFTSLKSL